MLFKLYIKPGVMPLVAEIRFRSSLFADWHWRVPSPCSVWHVIRGGHTDGRDRECVTVLFSAPFDVNGASSVHPDMYAPRVAGLESKSLQLVSKQRTNEK